MSSTDKQIFHTANPTRWQRFKWGGRLLIFILIITIVAVVIAIRTAVMPTIPIAQSQAFKKILETPTSNDPITKEYQGFRKFIDLKWEKVKGRLPSTRQVM